MNDAYFKEMLTRQHYLEHEYCIGSVVGKVLEDQLGIFRNPLIVLLARTIGKFIEQSSTHKSNPYPLRIDIKKYYFYHKYIDVHIIELNHDDLAEAKFMVIERETITDKFTGNYMIYGIC
jgi:hypothetical protein